MVGEAVTRVAAHRAPAVLTLVRSPLSPRNGRCLPSIPSSTGGGARCYRCVVPRRVFSVLKGARKGQRRKTDETSTQSTGGTGGGAC